MARLGFVNRPIVVCVSRLVPRKGQDMLIRAWPAILRAVPDAALLLVGGGPYRARLERLVDAAGLRESVVLTGSVPWSELPAYYDAGNVFAMPCRTRVGGLDVEGLGIVYLEASATGLPVIAGNSGERPTPCWTVRPAMSSTGGQSTSWSSGSLPAARPGPGADHGKAGTAVGRRGVALGRHRPAPHLAARLTLIGRATQPRAYPTSSSRTTTQSGNRRQQAALILRSCRTCC